MKSKVACMRHDERGVVSLLTVIFFMIFISLLVVGFITLVITDQKQTTDSDLSATALAAARSGIEDGKRILAFCAANPTDADCVPEVLNSADNCNVFKSIHGVSLASRLSIPIDTANGQGVTGGADDYKQYFTCLTIQQDTPYITIPLSQGSSFIQPLTTTQPFTKLTISWSGTGSYANRLKITEWPNLLSWKDAVSGKDYAPVIRLQFIPYQPTTAGFSNLDDIEKNSRTVFVAPCTATATGALPATCVTSTSIDLLDQRTTPGTPKTGGSLPLAYGACTTTGTAGYECSAQLTGFVATSQYYLRATVLYASNTTLKVSPADTTGQVTFDNVQPWIDVTGRTSDVFRRVRSQVSYNAQPAGVPENAIDSAAPICKQMTVTSTPATSTFDCN